MAVTSFGFALIGGSVGFGLGHLVPGYYKTVFGGDGVIVDPVQTGVGLGVTQGLFAGLLSGAFLVVWYTVRPRRVPKAAD